MPDVNQVVEVLATLRANAANESEVCDAIEAALTTAKIPHARERRLDGASRIDFLVDGGIGIEVKVRGSRQDLLIQANRYLLHPELSGLVIVSTRSRHTRGLPPQLHDKPLRAAYLLHAAF